MTSTSFRKEDQGTTPAARGQAAGDSWDLAPLDPGASYKITVPEPGKVEITVSAGAEWVLAAWLGRALGDTREDRQARAAENVIAAAGSTGLASNQPSEEA